MDKVVANDAQQLLCTTYGAEILSVLHPADPILNAAVRSAQVSACYVPHVAADVNKQGSVSTPHPRLVTPLPQSLLHTHWAIVLEFVEAEA